MPPDLQHGFRVGPWKVEPLTGTITGPDDESCHIPPKVMDVLVCLARRASEPATSKELLEEVWGENTVSDDPLTHAIGELRRVLHDDPGHPKYIETIPKRGYRLLVPVDVMSLHGTENLWLEPIATLWEELKRRKVVHAGITYAAIAWLVIQGIETIGPRIGLPEWAVSMVIVSAILALPVVVALVWLLELTPQGIRLDRSAPRRAVMSRGLGLVVIASLTISAGILWYQYIGRDQNGSASDIQSSDVPGNTAAAEIHPKSIAVLPFVNMTGNADDEYIADGLAEELINLLANIEELRVASRTAGFYFKDKNVDLNTIAQKLRVKHIFEGSLRRQDETLRVTAQLIDMDTGYHIWSSTFDRRSGDVLAIQQEIARAVVDALTVKLSVEVTARLMPVPTESIDAFDFYLQGRDYLRRPTTDSSLEVAARLFQRALELDPQYARAFAGLCDTYLARYALSSAIGFFEAAERACHRALTLNPALTEVYVSLARLYRYSGQYEDSIRELDSAIARNPNNATAYSELGETHFAVGNLVEAEKAFRRAIDLEPGYWGHYTAFGNFLYRSDQYEKAREYYQLVVELTPDSATAYSNLAAAYYMLDDYHNAASAWHQSLEIRESRAAYTNTGLMYYYTGRFEEAAEMQAKALELAPDDHRLWGRLAESYRFIDGQSQAAEDAYTRAIEVARASLEINPSDATDLALLGLYLAHANETSEAREAIYRALELSPADGNIHYLHALISHELGEEEMTYEALRHSVTLGFSRGMIAADPDLTSLHDHQDFKALLAQRRD